ncbi:rod shape-determining protein RodA [bacterium]|nr:rod shape-determining protein RodA [bacterium]
MAHKRHMIREWLFERIHWPLIIIMTALCIVGFALLYSAANGHWSPWAGDQMMRGAVGLVLMVGITMLPLRWLLNLAYPAYALCLVLLVIVELFGVIGMGAQRWINLGFFVLQPSEPTKLALILVLARYFHRLNFEEIGRILVLVPPALLALVPAGLVLLQPNLGTAGVLMLITVGMFWVGGVRWWKFALAISSAAAAMPVAWHFLHDYQKQRVLTFLHPEADPLGAGYNILQSMIAIGSGGLYGRGFLKGPQSQLDFLPEKHTDFVYTMLAEEFGFYGTLGLLSLYIMLLVFAYHIAMSCTHHFGRMVALGVAIYFFVHVFINMAMVMGMLPVVGLPLPFLSYGGTNMLTSLAAVGLLLNVYANRDEELQRMA